MFGKSGPNRGIKTGIFDGKISIYISCCESGMEAMLGWLGMMAVSLFGW